MTTTYNPVQGPFDASPARQAGTTLVIGTANGFRLLEPTSQKRLPPPEVERPGFGGPKPTSEQLAVVGQDVLNGYKKMFSSVQRTPFGRKWLGGNVEHYFLVDIARHVIADDITVPTKESTLYFVVSVRADVEIADPLQAVEKGVTDVWGYLATEVRRRLTAIAAEHGPNALSAVQSAMQAAVDKETLKPDPFGASIVRVIRVHIVARLDEVAQKWVREVEEAAMKKKAIKERGEVAELARANELAATTSPEQLMAQWLQTGDERYKDAMMLTISGLDKRDERRSALMTQMLESKMIKDHDIHDKFPDLVEQLFGQTLSAASGTPALQAAPTRLKIADEHKGT